MKSFWMAAALAGALAACSQGGASGSEEELAARIVDVGGVLNIDEATINQVVDGHTQMIAAQQGNLTPAQAEQISAGIKSNIEAALPELKEKMASQLVEVFEPRELEVFLAFVAAEEHESIKQKIGMVTQQSLAAADEMTMKAVEKAIADAKLPPPVDPTQPAVPGVVKPNNPQQ